MKENKAKMADFIREKIAEYGESSIFDAVKAQYPNVSDWEIRQSIMILRGGDIVTVERTND